MGENFNIEMDDEVQGASPYQLGKIFGEKTPIFWGWKNRQGKAMYFSAMQKIGARYPCPSPPVK